MTKDAAVKCPECGWTMVKKSYNKRMVWYCPHCHHKQEVATL